MTQVGGMTRTNPSVAVGAATVCRDVQGSVIVDTFR